MAIHEISHFKTEYNKNNSLNIEIYFGQNGVKRFENLSISEADEMIDILGTSKPLALDEDSGQIVIH